MPVLTELMLILTKGLKAIIRLGQLFEASFNIGNSKSMKVLTFLIILCLITFIKLGFGWYFPDKKARGDISRSRFIQRLLEKALKEAA
jgi:hypothetical protein